jgi:hypothetical protein
LVTRSHTRKPIRTLKLIARKFIRLTFASDLRARMRLVWLRKKVTDTQLEMLGDCYEKAFDEFLYTEKIPKQVSKINRTTNRLHVRESVPEKVQALQKIAIKRQQPLAVVIEEALRRYLDKPENYLGKDHQIKERVEKLG